MRGPREVRCAFGSDGIPSLELGSGLAAASPMRGTAIDARNTHIQYTMASIIRRIARPMGAAASASRHQRARAFSSVSMPPLPQMHTTQAHSSQPTSWMPVPYVTETVVR